MADALTLWLLAQAQAGKLEPTIAGGPPSFTGMLGQQVFDTKYGVTWWYDGSTWHANGPGLLVARAYQGTGQSGITQGTQLRLDTLSYDPSSLFSNLGGTSWAVECPIAGRWAFRYRVHSLPSSASAGFSWCTTGSTGENMVATQNSISYGPIGTDIIQCSASQIVTVTLNYLSAGTMSTQPRTDLTYFTVEFISS